MGIIALLIRSLHPIPWALDEGTVRITITHSDSDVNFSFIVISKVNF